MFLKKQTSAVQSGSRLNRSWGSLLRLFAVFLIMSLFSSCSDQGCIEADDFGEYDTQTLEVPANTASDNCAYDISKSITDAAQGSGLKSCFTQGSVTIYDENDVAQTSSTGCIGLPSEKFKNLCVNQCLANCMANIGSDSPNSSEPGWTSTDQKSGSRNGGVIIRPKSLIYIRAVGAVRLGDKLPYPDFYVSANDMMPQSKTSNWINQNLDLRAGKSLTVLFSGKVTDNSPINGTEVSVGQVGAGNSGAIDSKVYNAARRLVAYLMPAPAGYSVDPVQPTEKSQYINVPISPDVNLWQCAYEGSDLRQSSCSNKSYKANGYINVDDVLVNSTFPITSDFQSTTLGQYGGVIRWKGDGVDPDTYDPFAGIYCEDPNCNTGGVDEVQGRIINDLSAGDVVIVSPVSGKVSFKNILRPTNTVCDDNLQVIVRDKNDNDIYYFDGTHASQAVSVTSANWSSAHIPVEALQKIVIRQKISNGYSHNGTFVSCDRALAIRFGKYKDIPITRSGFVSFAMLNGTNNNFGCTIKARIINPSGKRDDDYYEYADFNSAGDPFDSVAVRSVATNTPWVEGGVNNGTNRVFVRKGQVIRFSPESWNGNWSATGGTRECGIGMAMRLEPRPALLCRGSAIADVSNTECIAKYNPTNGNLIGCSEFAAECNDSSNANYYCQSSDPKINCTPNIICNDGVSNPDGLVDENGVLVQKNTRYNCKLENSVDPKCSNSCFNCSNLRKQRAGQSPFVSASNIAQCYDLENYTGKVSNIPINGFSESDLKNTQKAKGATILGSFNGDYGNLIGFGGSGKVDKTFNNNTIFQVTQPISITKTGRLSFIFLDGSDFNQRIGQEYGDNVPLPSDRYTGSNGFKISLASALEFTNGEWLEAKLCQELPNDTLSCKKVNLDPAAIISSQPKVVELNPPSSSSLVPVSNTPFYFDASGNLIRTKDAGLNDCLGVLINDTYYCHTTDTAAIDVNKIRLTFKIKDPEAATCDTNDPTNAAPLSPNGILMTNTRFRASDCVVGDPVASKDPFSVKNGITVANSSGAVTCVANSDNAGKTCLPTDDNNSVNPPVICSKEFRCVSKYANNSGKYYVTVRVKTPGSNISNIVNDVITPVIEVMDGSKDGKTIGQAERIYKLLISDPRYQAILSISLVVMIAFYGFGYLIGVTESGLSDMINRLIKISLIYLFVGPEGWYWFNTLVVKFFKDGTDYLAFVMASSFDNSSALQNAITNYDFYDKSILFSSVDKVFGIFFSSTVQKKISALLFASIFGWAYLLIIYYGMLLYVYAVANSVLLYLTSQVFISILFVLGPLFFVFTLFSQTKEMFDKWLSQLISFSLQQIFLLTTLAFFNMMMYEVIKMVLGYKICWDEVWTINIITRITLMSFWTIASLPPRVNAQSDAGNIGNPDGIPSFFTILFIWVIADLMLKFVDFMTNMAASISGGIKASSLSSGIKSGFQSMGKFVGARAGEIWDKTGGQAVRQLDKTLFDSGKMADQERAARKQENSKNLAHKKAFTDAGNKAISEFKRNNGAELAKMSKEDQEKALNKVKNEATAKEGAKRGLSAEDVERIKKDKGFKYEGTNAFGAAYQAIRQATTKGGTLTNSLNDKKADTKFSGSEARQALKNTDEEGRKAIVDAAKKGDIYVKKSGAEKAKDTVKGGFGARAAAKGIASAAKAVGKAVYDKEYNAARDQLVAEGTIPKMAAGTYGALPKEAKDKINARVELNRKQQGKDNKQISTDNTVAKLEQYRKAADEKSGLASGEYVREEGKISALIGREKTTEMALTRGKLASEIKEERATMAKEKVTEDHIAAESNLSKAEKERDTYSANVAAIVSNKDFQDKTKEMGELTKKINDSSIGSNDRADARRRMSELKADKDFAEQNRNIKEFTVKQNEANVKVENYTKAANKLQDKRNDIEDADNNA